MAKLTPQERITRAKIQLMRSPKFCLLSGIAVMGKMEIREGCGTAYTNGRDTYFDPNFIEPLTEKQLNFLVCHELWHIALKQITTWKKLWKENPRLTNMAADYVANQMIVDADPNGEVVQFIEGGCLDPKYKGWNTKQVYDDLKKQQDEQGSGNGGGEPYDEHDFEAGSELSEKEVEALGKAVDEALRQGMILAGKMGGNVDRTITRMLEPKVDWREMLRDFVSAISNDKEMSTWRKPNRRHLSSGTYLPSMFSETVGPIVVGIDTSGSIGQQELEQFLGELGNICQAVKPERIHLLWWDTHVAGVDVLEPGDYHDLVNKVKPAGGGGTDVSCVFDYVEREGIESEACIVLTDGYTPFPTAPRYPVFWGMTTDVTAPFGTNVRVE
jgi:predicted metal-dependent peptidase